MEGAGQPGSIAEGINEGDEGEADATSADTELLVSPSRRPTEDSVVSSMLGEASKAFAISCCAAVSGCHLPMRMCDES